MSTWLLLLVQCLATFALGLLALPAHAVILNTPTGTENTGPPPDDPGVDNFGSRGGLGGTVVAGQWVLTANHIGPGSINLGGQIYQAIPNSKVRLTTPGGNLADMIVFKLFDDPGLPTLSIRSSIPSFNTNLTMIGYGTERGAPTHFNGLDGWLWGNGQPRRWGTNRISGTQILVLDTATFATDFDSPGTPGVTTYEAQASTGDSGGAVFIKSGSQWQLAGMMLATGGEVDQPANTTLFTNVTYSADLSYYRDEILAIVNQPTCGDGVDDDVDGFTDYPADPGCDSVNDATETSPALPCDDGIDNDLDGFTDYPDDLDCATPSHPGEAPPVPFSAPIGALGLIALLGTAGVVQSSSNRTW